MVVLTTTQEVKKGQTIKAVFAIANGEQVKILGLRNVYDVDPSKPFLIADVQTVGAILPHGIRLEELHNIYAMVKQVIL